MTDNRSTPWDWERPHLTNIQKRSAQRYDADVQLRHAIREARRAGVTWDHIGLQLGITRQAAQARFGRDNLFRGKQ
jgi:hypothetical protein